MAYKEYDFKRHFAYIADPNNITEYRFDSDDVVFYPPTRKG